MTTCDHLTFIVVYVVNGNVPSFTQHQMPMHFYGHFEFFHDFYIVCRNNVSKMLVHDNMQFTSSVLKCHMLAYCKCKSNFNAYINETWVRDYFTVRPSCSKTCQIDSRY